jgi:hypothetical protein
VVVVVVVVVVVFVVVVIPNLGNAGCLTFNPFGGRGKGRDGLKLGILCPSA